MKKLFVAILAAVTFGTIKAQATTVEHVTNINELGDLTHYNGIIFEDFYGSQADIEGALAIGRDAKFGNQFDIGVGYSGSDVLIGSFPNPSGYPTLLLNGEATPGTVNNVTGGPIVMNSNHYDFYTSQINSLNGTLLLADSKITDIWFDYAEKQMNRTTNLLNHANNREGSQITVDQFTGWKGNGFFSDLSAFEPNNLIIGAYILVINVMDEGDVTINEPHITSEFSNYSVIVFNFPNATSVNFTGGSIHVDNQQINTSASQIMPEQNAQLADYAGRIIWNLPIAESIDIYAHGVVGSILAPNATVNTSGGSINGMLVANDLNMTNGFELHGFKMTNILFNASNKNEGEIDDPIVTPEVEVEPNEPDEGPDVENPDTDTDTDTEDGPGDSEDGEQEPEDGSGEDEETGILPEAGQLGTIAPIIGVGLIGTAGVLSIKKKKVS